MIQILDFCATQYTTNVYKQDPYAGARGFNPEFRQFASRVPNVPAD